MIYNVSYYILVYNLGAKISFRKRMYPFVFTFFFLLIILIVELFSRPYAWNIFHNSEEYYLRIRLTTVESSHTVPLIIVFGVFTLFFFKRVKNIPMLCLSAIAMIMFIASSSSRSLLLFAIFFILIILFRSVKKKKISKIKFLIPVLIISVPFIGIAVAFLLYNEVFTKSLGSLASRMISTIAVLIHMIYYPFGMGNAVCSLTIKELIVNVMDWFMQSGIDSGWNYWEINYRILTDDESNGLSGGLSYLLHWGAFGMIYFFYGLIKVYKRYLHCEYYDKYIAAAFWGFVATMMITIPINNCFTFWGFLALISLFSLKNDNLKKQDNMSSPLKLQTSHN